jgi:hypothetical protein
MFIMFLRRYLFFVSLKKLDVFIGGRWGRDIVEVGLEVVESVVDMRKGREGV